MAVQTHSYSLFLCGRGPGTVCGQLCSPPAAVLRAAFSVQTCRVPGGFEIQRGVLVAHRALANPLE